MFRCALILLFLSYSYSCLALDITTTGELGNATALDSIVVLDESDPAATEPHRILFTADEEEFLNGLGQWITLSDEFEPLKTADDNYVTDAEKTVIGNTSGTNTGDQDLSGKQDDLDVPSQAEAEAGSATTERVWTAQRVAQAIAALASGSAADDTAYDATSWDSNTDAATKNAIRDKIETLGSAGEENVNADWDATSGDAEILNKPTLSSGDVVGPASSTDNTIAIFDSTTGKLIQEATGCTISSGVITCTGGFVSTAADTYRGLTLNENSADTNVDNQSIHYTANSLEWKNESGVDKVFLFVGDEIADADIVATIARDSEITAAQAQALVVSDLDDSTTPSVLTAAETTSRTISNYKSTGADHVFTLPTAHIYGQVIFVIGDEFQVDVEPPSGTALYLNGTEMASDEHIENTADTLAQQMVCFCASLNGTLRWMCESKYDDFAEATP